MRQLQQAKSAEEPLQRMANTLTNKLLHDPSSNLRNAASHGHMELIRAAQEIFNLQNKK